jgi:hypothetical protein
MYHRRERPLNEDERQRLTARLEEARKQTLEAGLIALLLLLVDAVVVVVIVMALLGRDRSGVCGWCMGSTAVVVANLFLFANIASFLAGRQEKRQLQDALADGVAVVEEVTAEGAAEFDSHGEYHVLAVAPDRLLALPARDYRIPRSSGVLLAQDRVALSFTLITTRAHRIRLMTERHGRSSLLLRPAGRLDRLVPDRIARTALAKLLEQPLFFAGALDTLGADLLRLARGEEEMPAAQDTGVLDAWGRLQAEIEEDFDLQFESGGLGRELDRRWGRAPKVGDLLALVRDHLPDGAFARTRPLRPLFLRLRDAVAVEWGVWPRQVRPSARLDALLPREGLADAWKHLGLRFGRDMPPLVVGNPPWGVVVLIILGLALVFSLGIPAVQAIDAFAGQQGFGTAWWYLLLGACCVPVSFIFGIAMMVGVPMHLFRRRIPRELPPDCRTVRDLVLQLARAEKKLEIPWTPERIWECLRRSLARLSRQSVSAITPEMPLAALLTRELSSPGVGRG